MNKFLSILLWVWQFPQNIIGFIIVALLGFTKHYQATVEGSFAYWAKSNISWGVCLGDYILLPDLPSVESKFHEYGHQKQSLMLGPLYLLVIGIYSAVFCNLWDRVFHKKWDSKRRSECYYNRWTEKWADKLGGVKRVY